MRRDSPILPGRVLDVLWIIFLAMAVIPGLTAMIAGLIERIAGMPPAPDAVKPVTVILALLSQELALFGLTAGVIIKDGFRLADLGLLFDNWRREAVIGLLSGLGLVGLNFLGEWLSVTFLGLLIDPQTVETLLKRENENILVEFVDPSQPAWLVAVTLFLVVIIAPTVEEIFFRGYSFPVLSYRAGPRNGLYLAALLFAVVHLYIVNFLPILLLGLALTWLYGRRGSLVAPIVAHAVNNALVVAVTWFVAG